MITTRDLERLEAFRQMAFRGIKHSLEEDGSCKIYEGEVVVRYPNYFEERDVERRMTLELHCYVLGPSRHYSWHGATLSEALDKAFADLVQWVKEEMER